MAVVSVVPKYEMPSEVMHVAYADRYYMHMAHERESWFRACGGLSVLWRFLHTRM
jgi:hypothetical protein